MIDKMGPEDIGVIFALASEEGGLNRVLIGAGVRPHRNGKLTYWRAGRANLVTTAAGVGAARSSLAVQEMVAAGAKLIISAGLAAGLDASLKTGDVVVAERVLNGSGAESAPVACSGTQFFAAPPVRLGYTVHRGDLISYPSVARDRAGKRAIGQSTGARALDMESHAIGLVCRRNGVGFAAVRAISDTADESLPDIVPALADVRGTPARLRIALSSPGAWPALIRLRSHSGRASANLGDFLALTLMRIVPG